MKLRIIGVSIIFCVGLTGANAQGNLSDGLVAYYPFDGNANDFSGNTHHGIEHGGLGYTSGLFGGAIDMDGSDDYVTVPDAEDLRMKNDFSVSMWFYANSADEPSRLLHKMGKYAQGSVSANTLNYSFGADPYEGVWYLYGQFDAPSGAEYYVASENYGIELAHVWHHFAFTKDGDRFTLYLDGAIVDSRTQSFTETVDTYDLLIGAGDADTHGNTFQHFGGQLDDLRIYDRAISVDEVGQLAVIPEPTSAVLLAVISGFGLFFRRRFLIV